MPWTKESGDRLAKRRKALGMTQLDVACWLSTHLRQPVWSQQVSKWERGGSISLRYAEALAELVDVPLEYFLNDDEQMEDQS